VNRQPSNYPTFTAYRITGRQSASPSTFIIDLAPVPPRRWFPFNTTISSPSSSTVKNNTFLSFWKSATTTLAVEILDPRSQSTRYFTPLRISETGDLRLLVREYPWPHGDVARYLCQTLSVGDEVLVRQSAHLDELPSKMVSSKYIGMVRATIQDWK
jgi:hypothetical protein